MKKKFIILVAVLFMVTVSSSLFAEYNRNIVVQVMRNNVSLLNQLKSSAEKGDFFMAAESLMELAKGSKEIENFTPKKGSQTVWKQLHEDLIKAAFLGIGACAVNDLDGLNASIAKITALNRQGHSNFR